MSPTEIIPLSKSQQPRAQTKRKWVKTRILTDTPEKQAIELEHEKRKNKLKGKQVTNIKEQGKSKKKQTKEKTPMYSSSEEMTLLSVRAPRMRVVNSSESQICQLVTLSL